MQTEPHCFAAGDTAGPTYLTLLLENTSSYMVKATISYPVNGHTQTQKLFLPAGLSTEVNAISLQTTELSIELCFDHAKQIALHVHEPNRTWEFGYGHLKLSGMRPEPPDATWVD